MNYTNYSLTHCDHFHVYLCFYTPACVLLNLSVCNVSSSHIISPQSPVHSMQSTNRLHHVLPLNHATCSTQGYSHNHKTTTAQTAVRPNHYLAVRAKPCQGEAPNILLPSHILIICN